MIGTTQDSQHQQWHKLQPKFACNLSCDCINPPNWSEFQLHKVCDFLTNAQSLQILRPKSINRKLPVCKKGIGGPLRLDALLSETVMCVCAKYCFKRELPVVPDSSVVTDA